MTDARAGIAAATARAPATRMATYPPKPSRIMTVPPVFGRNIPLKITLHVQRSRGERFQNLPAPGRAIGRLAGAGTMRRALPRRAPSDRMALSGMPDIERDGDVGNA